VLSSGSLSSNKKGFHVQHAIDRSWRTPTCTVYDERSLCCKCATEGKYWCKCTV